MVIPPKPKSMSPSKKRKAANESPAGGVHGIGAYGYYAHPYGNPGGPPPQLYGYPQHQQHFAHDPFGGHPVPFGSYPPQQPPGYGQPPNSSPTNAPNSSPNGWGNPSPADSYPNNGAPKASPSPPSSKQTPSRRQSANASIASSNSQPPSSAGGWHPSQHWQGGVPPPGGPPYGHGPPPPAHMWNHRSSPNQMEGNWNGGRSPPNGPRGSPRGSSVNAGTSGRPSPVCMPIGSNGTDMMKLLPKKSNRSSTKDDKGRGSYRCGKCGVPKKGHICPYQPKFKRRADEPAPETRSASTQVEMDEFLVLRRLNLEIQGFPESYIAEPKDNVGAEAVYSVPPPPPPGMGIMPIGSMEVIQPQMHSTGVGPGPEVNLSFSDGQHMDDRNMETGDSRRDGEGKTNSSSRHEQDSERV